MKANLLALAVMLATFLISCNREIETPNHTVPDGYYEEVITAIFPDDDTRTSFDNTTGRFSWTEGDMLAFHLSDGSYITAPIDLETGKVHLLIKEGIVRDEFAVYPASTVIQEHSTSEDMMLELPASYNISNNLMSEYAPTTMLAVQDPSSSSLRFNHAGALVQLNLNIPRGTKTVKVDFGKAVTGQIALNSDGNYYKLDLSEPEANTNQSSSITVTVSEMSAGLQMDTDARINIPVPSGTYGNVKITYNDGQDNTWEYTKTESFNVTRSGGKRISPTQNEFKDVNYRKMPFTIEVTGETADIRWNVASDRTVIYSFNNATPQKMTNTTTISAIKGDIIKFWGQYGCGYGDNTISSTGEFIVYGNFMSLDSGLGDYVPDYGIIRYKDFTTNNTVSQTYLRLFSDNSKLISAANLIMPSAVPRDNFQEMFRGCTNLTEAPELPATRIGPSCYNGMFMGCSSLTKAPKLPATTLENYCYEYMFAQCTSLTEAPELPTTTLANYCYARMFTGCTSLTEAPELPATTLSTGCYQEMFRGCTSLTKAPELPARINAAYNYSYMFYGCTSLNYVKALFIVPPSYPTYQQSGTYNWLYGTSPTGTFIKSPEATWDERSAHGIPEGWDVYIAEDIDAQI